MGRSVAAAIAILRRGRLGKFAFYGASRGITQALLGARGLLLATLLGPKLFGVWALFRIAMHFASSAGLGLNRGLEREIAQAEPPRTERTGVAPGTLSARTAVGFKLLVFGAIAIGAFLVSFWVADPGWRLGLRGFAAAVVTSQLVTYGLVYLRVLGDVRAFAALEIANAAIHLACAALGAILWGLPGAFGGFVLASACSLLMLARRVPLRPALSPVRLRRLLHIGFPVSVAMAVGRVLTHVDRLAVAAIGGMAMLGYYAFAVSVAGLATAFAWVIRTIVFPDVYSMARSAGEAHAIRGHFERTVVPFARLYPPLLGVAALAIGPAVLLVAPQYAPAIEPAQVFIFAGTTLGFVSLGSLAVVAADRQRLLPLLGAAAVLLNVGLSVAALRAGVGLTAVAVGALLSQALYGAAILTLAARIAGMAHRVRLLLRCYVPLAWCALAVFVARWLAPGDGVAALPVVVALYALLMIPLTPGMLAELRKARGAASPGPDSTKLANAAAGQ